jgi:ABC-type phosphate transport system substrate-binding protein
LGWETPALAADGDGEHMSRRFSGRVATLMVATFLAAGLPFVVQPTLAAADTSAGTVIGEGGDVTTPVMLRLFHNDDAALTPDNGSYTNVGLESAIGDFIGTGPGSFATDFIVSERPLSSAEAAQAKANGRSFAYIPFAAVPVAIVTLAPNNSFDGQTVKPNQYCQHIPLSLTLMADIYGNDQASPLLDWSDSRISCSQMGASPYPQSITIWANEERTMENYALMNYLDSTVGSQQTFKTGLTNPTCGSSCVLSTDTTPSENYPADVQHQLPGGDEVLLGHLLALNQKTKAPNTQAALVTLGATLPVSSVWTGEPLGVSWNLPTAAIQNANGAYVPPTSASAQAAETDSTMTSTTDPTTNNLVTFNAAPADAAAYNNYLMMESYLVVPTSGLPSDKATALAQFIRYVLGAKGQADITSFGAAPATANMVAAGLKVAQAVASEAANSSSNSLTGSTATTTTTSNPAGSSAGSPSGSSGALGAGGGGGLVGTSAALAATGADTIPLLVIGTTMVLIGGVSRNLLRRRRLRT